MKKKLIAILIIVALIALTLTACNAQVGEKGEKGEPGANGNNGKDGDDGNDVISIGGWVFSSCENFDIYFAGMRAEWDAIPKGENWDKYSESYTVHCVDDIE